MRFSNARTRLAAFCSSRRFVLAVVARAAQIVLSFYKAGRRGTQYSKAEARAKQRQQSSQAHQIRGTADTVVYASLIPLVAAVSPDWWLELKTWGPFAILCGYLIWDLRTKDASRETRMSDQISSLETRLFEYQSGIGSQSVEALANNSTALASIRETMATCMAGMQRLEDSIEKLNTQMELKPCQLNRENFERFLRAQGIEPTDE